VQEAAGAPTTTQPSAAEAPAQEAEGARATARPLAADSRKAYGLPRPSDSSQITVEIAATGLSPAGKLQFTTVDAMVWRQIAGDPAKAPRPGAKVVVSTGALGGHWCQLDRWTSIRCDRIK
jgi:hypothetical protein